MATLRPDFTASIRRPGPDQIRDTFSQSRALPAAGRVLTVGEETSAACLAFPPEKEIPEQVARWRQPTEPGQRVRHPGLHGVKIDTSKAFGTNAEGSDHVTDVLALEPATALAKLLNEHGEQVYRIRNREPLGKSRSNAGPLPAYATSSDFRFGVKSDVSESAKDLLFPSDSSATAAEQAGAVGPGQQKRRNYDWSATTVKDPSRHRFGMVEKNVQKNGVAVALNPAADPEVPHPAVMPKRVADVREARADHLGRCKTLPRDADVKMPEVFGRPPLSSNDWGAGDCIRGDYALEDQLPDPDLGKSVSKGFRNYSQDPARVFGVPTIRTDIPVKTKSSVADHQNYGNDPSAGALLQPSRFAYLNIGDEDFTAPLPASEIRSLFEALGYTFDDGEFSALWYRASTLALTAPGSVCVEEFRLAVNEYDDARDHGVLPSWMH